MGGFTKGGSSTVLTDLQVDGTTVTVDASNNRLGLGTASPGTQVQVEGSAPYITLKNDKIIKLPKENYVKILKSFISLNQDKKFDQYKIFDYRINNQLILN